MMSGGAVSSESESRFKPTPPPFKTDRLFGPDIDWETDAERAYSRGFRRAGLQLAAQVCESGKDQDTLVYPIVYLYRHHAELVLKSIIECARALLNRNLTESDRKTLGRHDLVHL